VAGGGELDEEGVQLRALLRRQGGKQALLARLRRQSRTTEDAPALRCEPDRVAAAILHLAAAFHQAVALQLVHVRDHRARVDADGLAERVLGESVRAVERVQDRPAGRLQPQRSERLAEGGGGC